MPRINLTRNQLLSVICLTLALGTAVLYWPTVHHNFVNLDDEAYITANPHVKSGLTWAGFVWSFQIGYAANWHPLTWQSHMVDCQLYGLNPGGHHLTSLLLHVANTLLLFLLLNRLTGAIWRSAFVAALFAWHPLHVESVAWACERKDVLSTFFWMLALMAYVRYAQKQARVEGRESNAKIPAPASRTRLQTLDYSLALFFFACGLMSKPMVVTLPCVLLLLDFWPLERVTRDAWHMTRFGFPILHLSIFSRLLFEKGPFFALAAAECIVTNFAQRGGGAVWSSGLPLPVRIANALVSYLRYISKLFWPVDLAVVYPYPHHWPAGLVICAILVLAMWSILFIWRVRQNPDLFVGWFWFLGTLVPAIGLVQVGPQSMADRYTYLPSIGLFLLIVWGLNDFINYRPSWRPAVLLAGTMTLAACLICTGNQLKYWQNSVTLLRHTIAITTDNYIACNFLGRALDQVGPNDESLSLYAESVRLEPHYPQAQFNLGIALLKRGWADKACAPLAAAVQLVPDDAGARYYYGTALLDNGSLDEAAAQFTEALRLEPDLAAAQSKLALALVRQGKSAEAIPHFSEAVRLLPDDPGARFNLGLALLDHHQAAEAAIQFTEELRLNPNEATAHFQLAQALKQQGSLTDAVSHYREALRLRPEFPEAKAALDQILSTNSNLPAKP